MLQAEFDGIHVSPKRLGQLTPVHAFASFRRLPVFRKQRLVLVVGPFRKGFGVAQAKLFGLQLPKIQEIAQVEAFVFVGAPGQPIRQVSGSGMVLDLPQGKGRQSADGMARDRSAYSLTSVGSVFRGVEDTANLKKGLVHKIIQRTMRQGTVFIQDFLNASLPNRRGGDGFFNSLHKETFIG
jgi:hypothetical protein